MGLLDMVLSFLACLDLQEASCLLLDMEVSHPRFCGMWLWIAQVPQPSRPNRSSSLLKMSHMVKSLHAYTK